VEIDQWFWSLFGIKKVTLPSSSVVQEYHASVPDDFRFTVKIPNSITLTHFYRKTKNDPLVKNPYFLSVNLFNDFLKLIEPLKRQLGSLMFQFEYLNKKKMPSQQTFQEAFSEFLSQIDPAYPYAIEIRNPNYLNEKYFDFLNSLNLGSVFLQGYYMPPVLSVYKKYASFLQNTCVIRLHGPDRSDIEDRSGGNWNRVLDQRDDELSGIAGMVKELLNRNINVYVNMNNHYEGSAPLSIRRLQKFLND
jgi:uncharacterized protein YecE (DUF72 family)